MSTPLLVRVDARTPRREAPLDLRLLVPALSAWAVAAAAAGWSPGAVRRALLGALVLGVAAGLPVLAARRRRAPRGAAAALAAAALLVVVATGLVLASVAVQRERAAVGGVPALAAQRAVVDVVAEVRGDPRAVGAVRPGAAPRVAVDVRVVRVAGRGGTAVTAAPVTVFADAPAWRATSGQRVAFTARLAPAEAGERAVATAGLRSGVEVVAPAGRVAAAAERLRAGLRAACSRLPADPRGLLPGLVVGDVSALPPDLADAMRAVGLTHLTAVSGSNTTLVVLALVAAASWCGLGRRVRLVAAGAGLAGFVVLARPEPSVLRAAVMGAVGLAGLLGGRPTRGLPVLGSAVVVLLVADPWLAREAGFALSVTATAGLLLLAAPWARRLQALGVPRPVALAVAVPAAAQAVCGPLVVLLQPQVNLLALPVNVLAGPAVPPATVLGLAVVLLAPLWPGGAALLAWPAGLCAWWPAALARVAADAPTVLDVPAGAAGALVVAAATLALLLAAAALLRWRTARRHRWAGAAVVLALLAGLLVRCSSGWGGPTGPWPPPDWLVVGCDVGQGDAVVLRSGPEAAVLVDAGPDPELVDGCLDRLGVRHLDAVVLTHDHADHVDGLAGALRGRGTGQVLVSPLAVDPAAAQVRRTAAAAGVPVRTAAVGDAVRTAALTATVLAPGAGAADVRDPDSSQVNDSSVVLLADVAGVRVLLLGDLEPDGQRALLAGAGTWPGGAQVDVVKVAHHGSPRQHPALYARARARVALVEVGEANDYGHPAAATLAVVEAAGARVLRTDRQGDVALAGTAAALRTLARGSDPRDAQRRARYSAG